MKLITTRHTSLRIFAAGILATAAASLTPATAQTYIELADSADRLIAREEWAQAEQVITSALRLEPANATNTLLLSNLGVVRTQLHNIPGALEAYDIALSKAPRSTRILSNRARTLLQTDDRKAAESDINTILEVDSIHDWALATRGLLRLSKGEYAGAEADLRRHQRHYPADADILAATGAALVGQGKGDQAIEWYDRSIATRQSAEAWFARTLLKIQQEKFGEAEDDLRRAIIIYPDYGNLYALRAMLKKLNHLLTEAEEDKKTALRKGADVQTVEELLENAGRREGMK